MERNLKGDLLEKIADFGQLLSIEEKQVYLAQLRAITDDESLSVDIFDQPQTEEVVEDNT